MEWFKFYGGAYLSDPKMLMLTACERSCWITLLSFASVAEDGGRIKYLTEAQLMTAANLSPMHEEWDLTVGVLKKFEELGMLTQSNGIVTIMNWNKRQESYLTNAERQKRHREKQKSNAKVTEVLQDSNVRIEENRIDKKDTSGETPQIEIVSEKDEEKPKKESKAKYPHAKKVFQAIFGADYDRDWDMDTTQLRCGESLHRKITVEGDSLQEFKEWCEDNEDDEFFPVSDSPYEMNLKWPKYDRYLNRKKS